MRGANQRTNSLKSEITFKRKKGERTSVLSPAAVNGGEKDFNFPDEKRVKEGESPFTLISKRSKDEGDELNWTPRGEKKVPLFPIRRKRLRGCSL